MTYVDCTIIGLLIVALIRQEFLMIRTQTLTDNVATNTVAITALNDSVTAMALRIPDEAAAQQAIDAAADGVANNTAAIQATRAAIDALAPS